MCFIVLHNCSAFKKKLSKKEVQYFNCLETKYSVGSCGRMGEGDEESFRAAGWHAERRIFNLQDFCLDIMIFIFNLF